MNDEAEALVEYRVQQADESLDSAQILMDSEKRRPSVNRSYYAMFYAVLALLALEGRETSKHAGAIALFDRDFVKKGVFDRELSYWLHDAFDLRQRADYRPMVEISRERARAALERARAFVAAVKGHIAEMIHDRPDNSQ